MYISSRSCRGSEIYRQCRCLLKDLSVWWSRLSQYIITFLLGDQERVNTAKAAEDGDYSDSLVLHAHQLLGYWTWQIKSDCVQEGHSCEYSLEEGSPFVHLLLQTHEQQPHLSLKRVSGEGRLSVSLFGRLQHVVLWDLRKLACPDVLLVAQVLSM